MLSNRPLTGCVSLNHSSGGETRPNASRGFHDRNRKDAARRENDTTGYKIIFRPHRCFVCKENSFATACEKACESASRRTSFSFTIFPVNSYSWTGQRPHGSTWGELNLHHHSTVILYIKSFIVESNHTLGNTHSHTKSPLQTMTKWT